MSQSFNNQPSSEHLNIMMNKVKKDNLLIDNNDAVIASLKSRIKELEAELATRPKHRIYHARLKSREQMEETIPRDKWGWWIDVCPGALLVLRDATAEDLERCSLKEENPNVNDYLCELSDRGSLVNKIAIKDIIELTK